MKCPECGTELEDNSKICSNCGKELVTAAEPVEVMPTGSEPSQEAAEPEVMTEETTAAQQSAGVSLLKPADPSVANDAPPAGEPAADPVPPKKKGMKYLIAAAAAVVVVGGVFAATRMQEKDPKTAVIDAFKSVYAKEEVTPMEEIFGFEEMYNSMLDSNTEIDFGMTLEDSSMDYLAAGYGSGFNMKVQSDVANFKNYIEMGVQYGGMDLASAQLYMDKTNLMLTIPELSKRLFTVNYADDIEGQIKNSPYVGQMIIESGMDVTVFTDYMDYIKKAYDKENGGIFDINALWTRYKEGSQAINDFKTAMTVEKTDKAAFTLDGKEQNCKGYNVAITKDSMISFLRTSSKFFLEDETFKKDILEYLTQVMNLSQGMYGDSYSYMYGSEDPESMVKEVWGMTEDGVDEVLKFLDENMSDVAMTVYVDKAGRLAAFDLTTSLTDSMDVVYDIKAHFELKGGSYLTQNLEGTITVSAEGEDVTIALVKDGTYDKKTLTSNVQADLSADGEVFSMIYSGNYNVENGDYDLNLEFKDSANTGVTISSNGIISDVVKGKSMTVTVDSAKAEVSDMGMIDFSGMYALKPLEGEVKIPEGEPLDVLAATQEEIETVMAEMYAAVFGLMMNLQ